MMQGKGVMARMLGVGILAVVLASNVPMATAQASPGTGSLIIVEQPPVTGSGPSIPQYQVVTQTPGTGSLMVPQPPASGSGPSIPKYQLVIPGANPSQNTDISLGQQLQQQAAPGTIVTVEGTRAR